MRNRRLLIGAGIVVVLVLIGGAIAAMVLAGGLGEKAAGDLQAGPGGPGSTAIVMHDNSFEPATVQVKAGAPTAFQLTNGGAANHNFTNSALGVSTGPMKPGDVATLTVAVPAGTTQFICTWHQGMTISVEAS
jgi:plastocyanin